MRFPSNKTLAKISVYVAVAGISSVMYLRWKIEDRVRNTEFFRLAFQTLRGHKGAVRLLGEPIKEAGFDIGDPKNGSDGQTANYEVSVKGSKERGTIFFSANRDNDNGWLLERLELELKSQPDKRFLLKTPPKTSIGNDATEKQP